MGNIVSPVGTKAGKWCVLLELVARDFGESTADMTKVYAYS